MAQKLTERQARFVGEYIASGGNATEAARRAGYCGSRETLAVAGHRLIRDRNVEAAIREQQRANREGLIGRTQGKRETLWKVAQLCADLEGEVLSEAVETLPDGTLQRTIRIRERVFDPRAAIEAIKELNRMDGDCPGDGRRLRRP